MYLQFGILKEETAKNKNGRKNEVNKRDKKIAIDVNEKQQLYLSNSKYNYMILPIFKKMGFHMNYKKLLLQPKNYIFIINTKDKEIFRSQPSILAPAFSQGARLLNVVDLIRLIDF